MRRAPAAERRPSTSTYFLRATAMKLASTLCNRLPDNTLRTRWLVAALVVVFSFLPDSTAQSASFPCEQAKSTAEETICSNPELSTLDEHLGQYYSAARSALKPADSCLVSDQKNWLRAQRDSCSDAGCLRQAYLRNVPLNLILSQPGVTRIRNVELPSVKALVWIVPPAQDQVAAPVNKEAKPLVAQGAIVNEVSGGDGYVLSANDGKRMLIVPLMFLESPTTEILASLSKVGGEYEVRGYAEAGGDGSLHFAPSRCVFVYRTAR